MNHVTVADMVVGKKYYLKGNSKIIFLCRMGNNGHKEAICIEDPRPTFVYNSWAYSYIAKSDDLSHFYPLSGFMVFVQGENPPTKEHDSYEEANAEAERLAKHYPNRVIYVYEVKRKFKLEETKVSKIVEL